MAIVGSMVSMFQCLSIYCLRFGSFILYVVISGMILRLLSFSLYFSSSSLFWLDALVNCSVLLVASF